MSVFIIGSDGYLSNAFKKILKKKKYFMKKKIA